MVTGGPGAARLGQPNGGDVGYTTEWSSLSLKPGHTVIFMQFVAQRPPGDSRLTEQAEALMNLADGEALLASPKRRSRRSSTSTRRARRRPARCVFT